MTTLTGSSGRIERGPGIGRRRRLGRKRAPQKLHVADRQLIDFEPPAEQGEPVPDQPDLVDLKPRALAVRKHNVADRGVGGQYAVDRADRDVRRVRGQRPRQQVGEDALVPFGRARLPARARRDSDDQRRKPAERSSRHIIRKPARC